MFFGQILPANKTSKLAQANNDIVRVSNVSADPNSKGKTLFYVIKNGEKFLVSQFDERKTQLSVDLYFLKNENVEFSVQGSGAIHLVGYCEPSDFGPTQTHSKNEEIDQVQDLEDEDLEEEDLDDLEEEDLDGLDEEDLEEEEVKPKTLKKEMTKPTKPIIKQDNLDDLEDEDLEGLEDEIDGLDEEDLEGLEDEEEELEKQIQQERQKKIQKEKNGHGNGHGHGHGNGIPNVRNEVHKKKKNRNRNRNRNKNKNHNNQ